MCVTRAQSNTILYTHPLDTTQNLTLKLDTLGCQLFLSRIFILFIEYLVLTMVTLFDEEMLLFDIDDVVFSQHPKFKLLNFNISTPLIPENRKRFFNVGICKKPNKYNKSHRTFLPTINMTTNIRAQSKMQQHLYKHAHDHGSHTDR